MTDAQVVTVVPDTPTKRREYEQQVVKTFFLSNADLKETIDLLRIVLGARRVAPLPGSNALTISDTPDKVAAAERILDVLDKERAEVVVEIEILEVNRTRLKEYGIEITSGIPGVDGVARRHLPGLVEEVHARRQPLLQGQPRHHPAARRHLPAAEDRRVDPASSRTPSCARPRDRPHRRASATRCRCR